MDSIKDILTSVGFSLTGKSGSNGDICFKYTIEFNNDEFLKLARIVKEEFKFPKWKKNFMELIGKNKEFVKLDRIVIVCDLDYKDSIIKDDNAKIRLCYFGIYDEIITLEQFKMIFSNEYIKYRDERIKDVLE